MTGRYRFFWNGVRYKIPLCCVLFFDTVWDGWTERRRLDLSEEYGSRMHVLTDNAGVILCPQCLGDRMLQAGGRTEKPADHT